jgi:hypothetical protein
VTVHQLVPSEVDAERLADLLADARAIPAAAFSPSKTAAPPVIDLSAVPVQRATMTIPASAASLMEAAEQQWAGFSR